MTQNETSSWRLTVVGGALNGIDFTFPADKVVLIGRSHTADLRMKEADVSGKHLNLFVRDDGTPCMRNLSGHPGATKVNGEDYEAGAEIPVVARDYIWLGNKVKIRLDAVPMPQKDEQMSASISLTGETSWMNEGEAGVPTAVIEEGEQTASSAGVAVGTFATRPADGTLATRLAQGTVATNLADGTFATRPAEGTFATVAVSDEAESRTKSAVDNGETVVPEMANSADGTASGTVGGDETVVLGGVGNGGTAVLPPEMYEQYLVQKRKEDEQRAKWRKISVAFGFVVVLSMLFVLWLLNRPTTDYSHMSFPRLNGVPDVARYALRDSQGNKLVEVDYPRNDKMSVTVSPESNGVSVVSYMGKDRDVPFFLQLEAIVRSDELEKSLMQSVSAWFARTEESGAGFVFDEKMKNEVRPQFFEEVFPKSCETRSLFGVRYVSFDYKRTWPDGALWHGVAIYFRKGDTVYLHRREIPEFYWARGGNRIASFDPNIAIYAEFINSYWESPGVEGLPVDRSIPELMASIRSVLAKERASDWRFLKKDIDAVLVRTWQTDPKTRDLAEGCLRQFREVLRVYYYGKYNAFKAAQANRDDKRMRRFRQDAAMVFDDPDERYYHLIGNGEVW